MPEPRRPLDVNLRGLVGKAEDEAVSWWKARFEQIAAIPLPTARAGALIPEWRELAALPKAQRVALTRARVLGFNTLAQEQQDKVMEARRIAVQQAPLIADEDTAVVRDEVVPTLPPDLQERMRAALAQVSGEQR